jgi:succinylglutamate desuccinylase
MLVSVHWALSGDSLETQTCLRLEAHGSRLARKHDLVKVTGALSRCPHKATPFLRAANKAAMKLVLGKVHPFQRRVERPFQMALQGLQTAASGCDD